jgi:hypothetical protein
MEIPRWKWAALLVYLSLCDVIDIIMIVAQLHNVQASLGFFFTKGCFFFTKRGFKWAWLI